MPSLPAARDCREAFAAATASPERLAELKRRTPLLTNLVPVLPAWLTAERGGRASPDTLVTFTSADAFRYSPALPPEVLSGVEGRFTRGEAVAVLNPEAKGELFGDGEAVGRPISVAGERFTVIAVRSNPAGYFGEKQAWVPVTFYASLAHRAKPGGADFMMEPRLDARPVDERSYLEALIQLRTALLPMLPADYRKGIKLSEDIPETTKQFIFQHKAVAIRGAVGALAVLLVALIGLANMLLVSVHEELREVGVRRAFGALRGDIFWHFLSQGVLLSGLGAGTGLAAGSLVCWATRNWSGTPLAVSAFWAGAGAVATLLAGTFTSTVPALIGARVAPVEALRYE